MINLHESMGLEGIELATPGSAVRLASVARHITDCATRRVYYRRSETVKQSLMNLLIQTVNGKSVPQVTKFIDTIFTPQKMPDLFLLSLKMGKTN